MTLRELMQKRDDLNFQMLEAGSQDYNELERELLCVEELIEELEYRHRESDYNEEE